jgi:uncharacterized membrane protein (UPF0127 family)
MVKKYFSIEKDGQVILSNVKPADTFLRRFTGLMMKKGLGGLGGIYLTPCNQIHTFMMRFRIDAIFISRENTVIYVANSIKPCRVTPIVRFAAGVIEASPGFASSVGLRAGDKLDIVRKEGLAWKKSGKWYRLIRKLLRAKRRNSKSLSSDTIKRRLKNI